MPPMPSDRFYRRHEIGDQVTNPKIEEEDEHYDDQRSTYESRMSF